MKKMYSFNDERNFDVLKTLLIIFALTTFAITTSWGATLTAKVGVGAGKGTVKVETLDGSTVKSSKEATSSTLQVATMTVSGGFFGLGKTEGKARYTATASTGYYFDAWYTNSGCTSGKQTTNPYTTGTTTSNKTYIYYAKFIANPYSIAFNGNGATSGNMSNNLAMTYATAQKLTSNAYSRAYTVTYNANGGSCETSSATATYTFAGWNTAANGSGTNYTDGQSVNNLTTTKNGTVTLYAKWNSASVTLPDASKAGAVFDGWFIGDDRIGFQGESYTPTANVTLIAKFVEKYDSEASWNYSEMKVDDVQSNALELVHFDNPAVSIVNTNINPINNGNGKVIKYDYATNTLIAHNAGTATIRFIQAETDSINADTVYVTITVTKHANALTVNGSANYSVNAYMGNEVNVAFSSANPGDAAYTVVQNFGANYGSYHESDSRQYLKAGLALGSAQWTVTQQEDYKYYSASTTMTLTTQKMAESSCYVLQRSSEESLNTITHGAAMQLSGPGKTLSFQAKKTLLAVSHFYVEYSSDGSTWKDIDNPDLGTDYSTYTYDISGLDANYIRFETKTGATLFKYTKNVTVTRKTYLNAPESLTINRKSDYTYIFPDETGSAELEIDWSCVNGGDFLLSTNNPHFRLSQNTITNTDCNSGKTTITVYYDAIAGGTENAKLFIANKVYNTEVNLNGVCRLRDQAINWADGTDVMRPGNILTNIASAVTTISYESDDPSVIRVEGNQLVAVANGTAHITATAAETSYYYGASDTKTIEVSDRVAQWIVWNQSLIGLRIGDADRTLNAYATSDEECTTNGSRAITYVSDDESIVTILDGNKLHVVGQGTTYITATQAGGYDVDSHNYIEISKRNKVVVAPASAGCHPMFELGTTAGTLYSMELGLPALQFEVDLNNSYNGQPDKLSFDYRCEKSWGTSSGDLIVSQYYNGEWHEVRNCGHLSPSDDYTHFDDISLNRNTTHLRFYRAAGGTGYHHVANIEVSMAQYIEAEQPEQIVAAVNETKLTPIQINYSGVSGMMTMSLTGHNPNFTLDKNVIEETSCGSRGSEILQVGFRMTYASDSEKDTLTITDGEHTRTIYLNAMTQALDRVIIWTLPDEQNLYTIQNVALSADCRTTTDLPAGDVIFTLDESSTTGVINDGVLSFTHEGTAVITASVATDSAYTDATPITKTIHVAKTPTSITAAPTAMTLVFGRGLEDIVLDGGEAANTFNDAAVEGSFSAVSGDVSTVGSHDVTVRFTPTNTDLYATSDAIVSVSVANNIFTVDGEWGTDTNWSAGDTPRADEDVTIAANVTITGDVEVNSLTITEGNTVTLAVTGSLTINNSSVEQPAYGNMVVKEGGEIILNGGETKVNNFTIEASIGDNSHEAKSGEIVGIDYLAISGDAYFDLMLDQSGRCSTGWYHISVPFPVDVMTGIVARWDDTDMTGYEEGLRNERDYAIMDYHEEIRATGKYGWKKFRGIMMPGKGYSMTINNTAAYYRFKKASGYAVEQLAELQAQRSAGDAADCGWNALGNGMLNIANLTDNDITVQMHDHATKTYQNYLASEVSFAVGSSFFFQASSDAQAVAMELSAMHDYLRAPQARFATADERYTVSLTASGANRYDDRVFVSANEDALYSYQAGRDVAKMGDVTEATISQIWCEAYGQQLCRAELPLINDNATFPLGIFSPKAGEYILSAQNGPANGELWLTYEDVPVWNLSDGDYTLSLGRGTINGYALHLVIDRTQPATPTDAENITAEHDGVKKVLINNVLYIVRDGMIFDATGTKIELQ